MKELKLEGFPLRTFDKVRYADTNRQEHVNNANFFIVFGNSSIAIFQRLFQEVRCVANAETVIVQVDNVIRRGSPLTDSARKTLYNWMLNEIEQ
jgi:acyl-CoA thioester hydrolase